jgi:hypothetical protein
MNNTNTLVSGDNKGYASYLFEQLKNGPTNVTRLVALSPLSPLKLPTPALVVWT